MKNITICSLFVLLFFGQSFAGNIRAAYITYTWVQGFTYKVDVHIYTKESSISADQDSITINYGDGILNDALDTIPRINGSGEDLGNNILYSVYEGTHTYPGTNFYVITFMDPNRTGGIINIENSVNSPLIIEDTLNMVDPQAAAGYNNSAVFSNPPINWAERGQVFTYSPAAYDADDDSLSFQLAVPEGTEGYVAPTQMIGTNNNNTFTINQNTGEMTWNTPQFCGTYVIAEVVHEWRRIEGGRPIWMGTVRLDMQITGSCLTDSVPALTSPAGTNCVLAGQAFQGIVSGNEPDTGQLVTVSAVGGPFDLPVANSPVFVSATATAPATSFSWSTSCNDVRSQPYTIVFKATDNFPESPLTAEQTLLLPVNAPAPQNLTATPLTGKGIALNWDSSYACSSSARFIGFFVWRKEGNDTSSFNNCQTGPPANGYKLVASYLNRYSFTDTSAVDSVKYSYCITALFGLLNNFGPTLNPVQSIPSNAAGDISVTGIPNIAGKEAITIYPNPATDKLVVAADNILINRIDLMDMLGRTLLTENVTSSETTIDLSHFAAGVYFVRVQSGGVDVVKKVVKE